MLYFLITGEVDICKYFCKMSDITMTKFSIVYFFMISLIQINVTKSDTEVICSIEIFCAIKIVSTEVGEQS